jgi:hypothetical protein
MSNENGVAKVTFGVEDAKGQRGKIAFWLHYWRPEPPFDWVHGLCELDWHLQDFLHTLAPLLDSFIKGKIVSISYTVIVPLPSGLKAFPDAAADCEEGATIEYKTSDNHKTYQTIPTFDHSRFGVLSELRDLELPQNEDIRAWIGYQTSPTEEQYEFLQVCSDNRGVDLAGWNVIKRIFRPRRKDRN